MFGQSEAWLAQGDTIFERAWPDGSPDLATCDVTVTLEQDYGWCPCRVFGG